MAYYAVNYIAKQTYRAVERRNNIHRKNQHSAFVIGSGPPESIIWAGQIEKYGVIWPASYGHSVGRTEFEHGKPYLYIHQPCCPSCHTEMLHRTVPKWVFSEKKVWRCPDCSEMVERPREMMYEEKQGVEKIVDREITQLANNEGRIQSSDPFSDNKKIITEVWNPN